MRSLLAAANFLFVAGLLFSTATTAKPVANTAAAHTHQFAREVTDASVPVGWTNFCKAQPTECVAGQKSTEFVNLDRDHRLQLQQINSLVNHEIQGIGDNDHYGIYKLGIVNWWTYPDDGAGNCNDYVLLKKKLLIEAGWPRSALLLTVVLDTHNEGHLVLMARTNDGDLILDNLTDTVKNWNGTGYTFIKRQTADDPNNWVRLESGRTPEELAMISKALASHSQ
ncbi:MULTISPECIES: transglutaminase-like cysteine peptidase [unclassified Rhizobium]|uniref:transglutaminase-like cysteine peptidase n=1 Tax=unclassified Rhizobium TaxID=2613769 RepID=UPI001616243D|nr:MULTISPECIES: transglutaminase-like cysteine peptidase [unclassified Rhizobium]MBB3386730.1 putative transglutaminase-like cysteine proteinase [Rhizobium sp. BK098]MBB3618415.1 putative transglutaminase-like cysteine proteinase [Rhizobium sp. BK609]MBB3684091.1 putative transglutaminase-like cysteine proteinase [Rhizobium sp. BK612]